MEPVELTAVWAGCSPAAAPLTLGALKTAEVFPHVLPHAWHCQKEENFPLQKDFAVSLCWFPCSATWDSLSRVPSPSRRVKSKQAFCFNSTARI